MLVARAASGDGPAFGQLVRRHLSAAHAAARAVVREPADAEDACQDAFLAALVHIETCQPAYGFRAWLLQIVKRKALDLCRRRRVRAAAVLGSGADEVELSAPTHEGPDALVERADTARQLSHALDALTEPQRSAILLHDVQGWSHGEIARRFGVAEGTSRARLFQARRRMREHLGGTTWAFVVVVTLCLSGGRLDAKPDGVPGGFTPCSPCVRYAAVGFAGAASAVQAHAWSRCSSGQCPGTDMPDAPSVLGSCAWREVRSSS
jgi:RNA polymerase sigma-70 factor (ECF subfamily)